MFRRNWSIWLLLIIVLGLIIGYRVDLTLVVDKRISIEDSRLPDVFFTPADELSDDYIWTEMVQLKSDESLYDTFAFDGAAYYVTATNQLREQFAYSYRLYRFDTEQVLLEEFPDAKPHRLNIEGGDTTALLLTKEYSDGRTDLISYNLIRGEINQIASWDGPAAKAAISYSGSTIGLIVDGTWRVINLLGRDRGIQYEFPAQAVVEALGPGVNHVWIYYEVDDLRYLTQYEYATKNSVTFLVNDRVQWIYRQPNWAMTRSDNGLQLYTWPELQVQKIDIEGTIRSIQVLNHELVDIRLMNDGERHLVFDVNQRTLRYNQADDRPVSVGSDVFHYFMPAVHRINRIEFHK